MPPNVLLLIADSVRAKNMSVYEYGRQTTPNLEDFASRSTVYNQARSPGVWSLPSHTSMFTGLHVTEHGLTSRQAKLIPGQTIWEELQENNGYSTAVFSANPFVTSEAYGLARGFETIKSNLPRHRFPFDALDPEVADSDGYLGYLLDCFANDRPIRSLLNGGTFIFEDNIPRILPTPLRMVRSDAARTYVEEFLRWTENCTGPWAACINLVDAHWPYDPIPAFENWGGEDARKIHEEINHHCFDFCSGMKPWWKRRVLESLYDGAIQQIDASIGYIIRQLDRNNVLDETLVVLTSDHGEGFGEPSRLKHGLNVAGHEIGAHEVLLHVPLIVKKPGQERGKEINEVATLTRFPTVTQAVITENASRKSFVPDTQVVASADYDDRYSVEMDDWPEKFTSKMDLSQFSGEVRVVYEDRGGHVRKYVKWGPHEAAIDVASPQESMIRSKTAAEQVEKTFTRYDKAGVMITDNTSPSNTVSARLRELGYI